MIDIRGNLSSASGLFIPAPSGFGNLTLEVTAHRPPGKVGLLEGGPPCPPPLDKSADRPRQAAESPVRWSPALAGRAHNRRAAQQSSRDTGHRSATMPRDPSPEWAGVRWRPG